MNERMSEPDSNHELAMATHLWCRAARLPLLKTKLASTQPNCCMRSLAYGSAKQAPVTIRQ
jgi:hypothetical protein